MVINELPTSIFIYIYIKCNIATSKTSREKKSKARQDELKEVPCFARFCHNGCSVSETQLIQRIQLL